MLAIQKFAVCREKFPLEGGRRMALVAVASDLGIRESRHIRAKYRITASDVLDGRRFAGEIVDKGSYRCDIHEGLGIVFRYLDGREQRMVATEKGDVSWAQGRWRPQRKRRQENPRILRKVAASRTRRVNVILNENHT